MNEQATEWSHLPNAAHIDWIIQDVELNLSDWDAAWGGAVWDAALDTALDTARDAARGAAWRAARNAAWFAAFEAAHGAARDAARDTVWDAAWFAARDAACDAALALVAYDHAGALFDLPVKEVRGMAYLGQPAAILMLPSCEVRAMRDNG